jgi:hypothetical protein
MIKYLQLRVHRLECVKMTENRQNFLGIPLETDPDAIEIATITTDAVHGLVAEGPPVRLGNRFTNGKVESYSTPKVIAEIPISDTDPFPRRVTVTLNMVEKDDGGGFSDLMFDLATELGRVLADEVGDELDRGITESDYYRLVERTAVQGLGTLARELANLLGLHDDPFRPVTVNCALAAFTDAPSGTAVATFREPNAAHHGEHRLTYGWHVATSPAMTAAAAAGGAGTGRSSAALSGAGYAPTPYGRPFRSVRFARPMNKRAAVQIKPPPKTTAPTAAAAPVVKVPPRYWYPSVIKPLGDASKP